MDIKKWFKEKYKNETSSIKNQSGIYKFLDKEGFYIVLFLCVCIVAITAVWVTKTNIDRLATEDIVLPPSIDNNLAQMEEIDEDLFTDEVRESDETSMIIIEDIDEEEDTIPTVSSQIETNDKPSTQSKAAPPKLVDSQENSTEPEEEEAVSTITMILPLKGNVGMKYAVDSLTYSKTLDQYTTHNGIDILAPLDTPVMAAVEGEVIEVLVDSRLGLTIALSHKNETITRYSNLSTSEMVKVGDMVEKGQVISGVGKSALFESSEEPHLHFEVLVDGEYVDPAFYLPVK